MTTEETLRSWLAMAREDEHFEFKEAKAGFDQAKAVDYCCAFANENGGKLILGVTDQRPRNVVGTKAFLDVQEIQKLLLDRLQLRVDVESLITADGLRVVIFHVPGRHRGVPVGHNGRFLMRSGGSLVSMTSDVLKSVFKESEQDWPLRLVSGSFDADEVVSMLDTQSYFDMAALPYPSTREAVLSKFEGLKLVHHEGGRWSITNLGAILFAKDLRLFDLLSRRAPRVIVYRGPHKLETEREHTEWAGYAVGFRGLVEFINGQVPSNEILTEVIRQDRKMFPTVAVRELVANALIHQDFETNGGVLVEIYSNRLEVSNPGKPMIKPDRFIDEHHSRSERIADLARRLGICEEKGSGIDKVVKSAEVYQLPAPDFIVDDIRTTAILFALRPFSDLEAGERVRACYQHCCLRYVMRERMTNQSLRERFKLSADKMSAVSKVITEAVKTGKVKPEDSSSASRKYVKYIPFWA